MSRVYIRERENLFLQQGEGFFAKTSSGVREREENNLP